MNEALVQHMFALVTSLSNKPRLMGPELGVYLSGLTFVENQFRLYNAALEQGMRELNREQDEDSHVRD